VVTSAFFADKFGYLICEVTLTTIDCPSSSLEVGHFWRFQCNLAVISIALNTDMFIARVSVTHNIDITFLSVCPMLLLCHCVETAVYIIVKPFAP